MPQLKTARVLSFHPALKKISSVVDETFAVKYDAATLNDDVALMKIRDVLHEAEGFDPELLLQLLYTAMNALDEIHGALALCKSKKEKTSHGKDRKSDS